MWFYFALIFSSKTSQSFPFLSQTILSTLMFEQQHAGKGENETAGINPILKSSKNMLLKDLILNINEA